MRKDEQIEKRERRTALAQVQKDTTRHWDLVAAAVEQAKHRVRQVAGHRGQEHEG